MPHVPHVYLPGPWTGHQILLDEARVHHLRTVLRRSDGDPVSYTDGRGLMGSGSLSRERVVRGAERVLERRPGRIVLAVAPPDSSDRARFLVEKSAELGVDRLVWLSTRRGEGRVPRADKAEAWSAAALEQSRGAWLTDIDGPLSPTDLGDGRIMALDPSGQPLPGVEGGAEIVLMIGPEGGWDRDEIPGQSARIRLGDRILRVETAALVAVTLLSDRLGRF